MNKTSVFFHISTNKLYIKHSQNAMSLYMSKLLPHIHSTCAVFTFLRYYYFHFFPSFYFKNYIPPQYICVTDICMDFFSAFVYFIILAFLRLNNQTKPTYMEPTCRTYSWHFMRFLRENLLLLFKSNQVKCILECFHLYPC